VSKISKEKNESFGERLRRLRVAKGYTESELGKVIGTSHRMIAYYEIQGGNPPADVLVKLARALDVSADELLGLEPLQAKKPDEEAENLRLLRHVKQVQKLPLKDRRNVLQLIDSLVEKATLKQAQGS